MAIAILDIDGTLVDTNYQHALAWFRAFRRHEITLPIWRIHRHIGMGGDQLISAVSGDELESRRGDEIRAAHDDEYARLIDEVQAVYRARELICALRDRGHTIVLASSAQQEEVDHYLDLLAARKLVHGWTTSADVNRTKPAPDLVGAALDRAGAAAGQSALMIGDTPWDVAAAHAAGVATLAVVTGGFSAQELREAGAWEVYESVAELESRLDETPLAEPR